MISTPYDLLRDKRQELGLSEPAAVEADARRYLLTGTAIGAALVAIPLGVTLVLFGYQNLAVKPELQKLRPVKAEVEQLRARAAQARAKLSQLESVNTGLVKGLLSATAGSALMTDLSNRMPQGVQLTEASEGGNSLSLKGVAVDPDAFERINALQLVLKDSPLVETTSVNLIKASRSGPEAGAVTFELGLNFRPPLPPAQEKIILDELKAEGLSKRLTLLQQEGVLQ